MGTYWDSLMTGFFTYAREAYSGLQPWDYPLFFVGIIAYIYLITQSATAAIVTILITVGLYGTTTVFLEVPDLMIIFYIFVIITLTSLFAFLIYKRRT
jgi:hypothetical protein